MHKSLRERYLNCFSVTIALLCGGLLGFGDACWNTQIYSLLVTEYNKESAQAFALLKFFQVVNAERELDLLAVVAHLRRILLRSGDSNAMALVDLIDQRHHRLVVFLCRGEQGAVKCQPSQTAFQSSTG